MTFTHTYTQTIQANIYWMTSLTGGRDDCTHRDRQTDRGKGEVVAEVVKEPPVQTCCKACSRSSVMNGSVYCMWLFVRVCAGVCVCMRVGECIRMSKRECVDVSV